MGNAPVADVLSSCCCSLVLTPQSLISHFGLRDSANASPQTYALGLKEVWEVPEEVRGCPEGFTQ